MNRIAPSFLVGRPRCRRTPRCRRCDEVLDNRPVTPARSKPASPWAAARATPCSAVQVRATALVTWPAPKIVAGRRYNIIKRRSPSLARQADASAARPRHAADSPGGPMPIPPSQPPGAGRTGPTPEPGARQPQPTPNPETRKTTRQGCQREARRPLPDPAAVRLFAVPDSAPPYDDEALAGTRSAGTAHTARADRSGGTTGAVQESDGGRGPRH